MNWKSTLKAEFNFDQFRPGQEEILNILSEKKSVLGLMPTGSGKSLTYQFFAKAMLGKALPGSKLTESSPGDLVLVVTPLIALMEDQSQKACSFGIDTGFIHSKFPGA